MKKHLRSIVFLLAATAMSGAWAGQFNGCGIGIADSGDNFYNNQASSEAFSALQTRIFRTTIHWDADEAVQNAVLNRIHQARARGVREVMVTFDGRRGAVFPDIWTWSDRVRRIIEKFGGTVSHWGPANEPNFGIAWLPGTSGAVQLAAYYQTLHSVLAARGETGKLVGPDFHDMWNGSTHNTAAFDQYILDYWNSGGRFGVAASWHPYGDVERTRTDGTRRYQEWVSYLQPGTPIYITEAGSIIRTNSGQYINNDTSQKEKVDFLLFNLGNFASVARVYVYHMRATPGRGDWDSGLMRPEANGPLDASDVRPAWHSVNFATHYESDFKPLGLSGIDYAYVAPNTPYNFAWAATMRHKKRISLYVYVNNQWTYFTSNYVTGVNSLYSPSGFPAGYWWYWTVAEEDDCDRTYGPESAPRILRTF